jgi:hypothetical protein
MFYESDGYYLLTTLLRTASLLGVSPRLLLFLNGMNTFVSLVLFEGAGMWSGRFVENFWPLSIVVIMN